MAGSCAEYDWSRVAVCHERSSPLADEAGTATPYAACKIAMQRSLEEFGRAHGLSSAWGRIFFQYGPGEHRERLVASVIVNLLEGREARCTHGRQIRSFLHVEDAGAAFAALLASSVQGPVNVGSGERIADRRSPRTSGARHRPARAPQARRAPGARPANPPCSCRISAGSRGGADGVRVGRSMRDSKTPCDGGGRSSHDPAARMAPDGRAFSVGSDRDGRARAQRGASAAVERARRDACGGRHLEPVPGGGRRASRSGRPGSPPWRVSSWRRRRGRRWRCT